MCRYLVVSRLSAGAGYSRDGGLQHAVEVHKSRLGLDPEPTSTLGVGVFFPGLGLAIQKDEIEPPFIPLLHDSFAMLGTFEMHFPH